MVNPKFHGNKVFKEEVEKFMNYTLGTTTQPAIKNVLKKIIPVF